MAFQLRAPENCPRLLKASVEVSIFWQFCKKTRKVATGEARGPEQPQFIVWPPVATAVFEGINVDVTSAHNMHVQDLGSKNVL